MYGEHVKQEFQELLDVFHDAQQEADLAFDQSPPLEDPIQLQIRAIGLGIKARVALMERLVSMPTESDVRLRLSEAATLLGKHPDTIRRWANKGKLETVRTKGKQRTFRLGDLLMLMPKETEEK